MLTTQTAFALCGHAAPSRRSSLHGWSRFGTWHKLAGKWSRFTFCGESTRWLAPIRWLRTARLDGVPAQVVEKDVKPRGVFCEACQSLSLHHLVPPGWPRFAEPDEARVAGDRWGERGDEKRQQLCLAIAEPDWRPALDAEALPFGPWGGRVEEGYASHVFRRSGQGHLLASICGLYESPNLVVWEHHKPSNPCRHCMARLSKDLQNAARSAGYAPYNRRAVTPVATESAQ